MRSLIIVMLFPLIVYADQPSFSASIDEAGRSFTVKTSSIEAVFKDCMIIELKNLLTGKVIADSSLSNTKIPRGLGCMSGNPKILGNAHVPWGCHELNQNYPAGSMFPIYHYPDERSSFNAEKSDNKIKVVWKGLTNGKEFFPEESIQIEVTADLETGTLLLRASGYSPAGGVFGIQVPVTNISKESRIFIPQFGGIMFDKSISPGLATLGGAPFIEAPVTAFEIDKGSLAIWKEDPEFHPYYIFFSWNGKSFSCAFEHLNLMPFEDKKKTKSVEFRINVFKGGWIEAMTPYRNWYRNLFKNEYEIRDSAEWANKIRVIIDMFQCTPEILRKVEDVFDPETVMFHNWNARASNFDTELPDWTPRAGYVDSVKMIHAFGFKTMAYVNTYCVNYNSPVFIRDTLAEKVLTRKSSVWKYADAKKKGPESLDEKLIGSIQGNSDKNSFEGLKDGQLIYGDPLSVKWRAYHVKQMKRWHKTTGTDANYEDTAGVAGDYGNGIVDGKFAGQGSVAMMKELLAAQPKVAMASEYGPVEIAFATRWPLVYAQAWGNDKFREKRIHCQYPVSTFLFGNTPWIPVLKMNSDFLSHLVTACSDALGGMGQMVGTLEYLNSMSGFPGHLKWRAQIFSRRRLTADFSQTLPEKNMICAYRDFEGRLYKYFDDGKVQKMVDPDGNELYARVDCSTKVTTTLFIPGWPAQKEGIVFGLDPTKRYALFPGVPDKTDVEITSMPDRIMVKSYYSEKNFAILTLDKVSADIPATGEVSLTLNKAFNEICVNGKTTKLVPSAKLPFECKLKMEFPAYILLSTSQHPIKIGQPLGNDETNVRWVGGSGIGENCCQIKNLLKLMQKVPGEEKYSIFFKLDPCETGERTIDFLVRVPNNKSAVKLFVKNNNTSGHGDGTIAKAYVNGKLVGWLDCTRNPSMPLKEKKLWDNDYHEWTVPLDGFAGKNILFSIAVDGKNGSNCDYQIFSMPVIVNSEVFRFSDKVR